VYNRPVSPHGLAVHSARMNARAYLKRNALAQPVVDCRYYCTSGKPVWQAFCSGELASIRKADMSWHALTRCYLRLQLSEAGRRRLGLRIIIQGFPSKERALPLL